MNATKIITAGSPANPHRRSPGLSAKPADGVANVAYFGIFRTQHWVLSYALLMLGIWAAPGQILGADCETTSGANCIVNQYPSAQGSNPPRAFTGWPDGTTVVWKSLSGLNDYCNDTNPTGSCTTLSVTNFVGDSANPGFYYTKCGTNTTKDNYLCYRVRVNWNGRVGEPSGRRPASPFNADTIYLMLQRSPRAPAPNYSFTWDFNQNDMDLHGMEMQYLAVQGPYWSDVKFEDYDGDMSVNNPPNFNNTTRVALNSGTDAYIRTVSNVACVPIPPAVNCITDVNQQVLQNTTFVDFAISCDYLTYLKTYSATHGWMWPSTYPNPQTSPTLVDLECTQNWKMQLGSRNGGNDHLVLNADVAGNVGDMTSTNVGTLVGPVPTYALLGDFGAAVRGNQVVVEWDTEIEAGTLGFELERKTAFGDFERVHEDLISGRNPAGEGGSYRVVDPLALPGFPQTYRLTEIEADGNHREIGEYRVQPVAKSSAAMVAKAQAWVEPMVFTPRPLSQAEQARLTARRGELDAAKSNQKKVRGLVADQAAIGIEVSGFYFIAADALAQTLQWPAGKITGMIKAGQLRLTNRGQDIAWLPATGNTGIYFYGEAPTGIYASENVYVAQQGPGTLMATAKVGAKGPAGPASFPATLTIEQNLFAGTVRAKDPEEDFWHWAMFNRSRECVNAADSCRIHDFALEAPAAANTGMATLVLKLRGNSASPGHRVAVSLNGRLLGEGQWDGLTDHSLSLPFQQSLLRAGNNAVTVEALDAVNNYFYLDRFELTYQREYRALDGQLWATGTANQQLVADGFSTADIRVFDLTDAARPKVVNGTKIEGVAGNYQISFVPGNNATPYWLQTTTSMPMPASLRAMRTTGLGNRKVRADYVVIGPDDFAAAGQRLVNHRASQGLTGKFVPLQAIYDEFSAGHKSPMAIRDFLAYARQNWRFSPRYVVLAGKGTFDPKDYLGYGTDRLPVLMALTEVGVIAADQRFVDFDGNEIEDIPIGRLPAVTQAEFAALVDKLIAYDSQAALRRVVLLADIPDTGGNYTAESEVMEEQLLAAGYEDVASDMRRLYLNPQSDVGQVRTQLFADLNESNGGVRLLNYFGHAGSSGLDRGLLTVSDAAGVPDVAGLSLRNEGRLPVMAGMTCFMNRFDLPDRTLLGEALLLNPQGGAAAAWSSGGWAYTSEARELDQGLFEALFETEVGTVGDAVFQALTGHIQAGHPPAMVGVYNLLGDPASRWQP